MIGSHTVQLLFDGLCLCLSLCRNANVDRNVHRDSPGVESPVWRVLLHVHAEGVDRLDPIDAARQASLCCHAEPSIAVVSYVSS